VNAPLTCPACGHEQATGDECGACGVIFRKWSSRMAASTSPGGPAEAPPAGRWLAVGVGAFLLLSGLALGLAWRSTSAVGDTDAAAAGTHLVRKHARVRQILGAEDSADLVFGAVRGRLHGDAGERQADLQWTVEGPRGEGRASITAVETAAGWDVRSALFRTPDGDVLTLDTPRPRAVAVPEPAEEEAVDPDAPSPEAVARAAELTRLLALDDEAEPEPGTPVRELVANVPRPDALDESLPGESRELALSAPPGDGGYAGWYRGAEGLERALEERATRPAPLLLYFHAEWCGYCRRLEKDYLAAAPVREVLGRVMRVEIAPEDGEAAIAVARRFDVKGYPTVLVMPAGTEQTTRVHPFRAGRSILPRQFATEVETAAGLATR